MLIPFGTHSYQHEARQLSSQRMVNCFLEREPQGSKSPIAVIRSPGIDEVVTLPQGPVRGALVHQEQPYFVSGNSLYRVSKSGTATNLGVIPNVDRVRMLSNDSQLGVLTNQKLYVFDGTTVSQVTDPGFGGAIDATYSDLFAIFVTPNSDQFFISDAAAAPFPDMTQYNALDFGQAEAAPGNIVAIEADHRELFIFKEQSTEIWTNTSNPDFTFQTIRNADCRGGR